MALGYYKLGQANKARRAERHEKRLARIALMPMLQVSGEGSKAWLQVKGLDVHDVDVSTCQMAGSYDHAACN